MSVEEKIAQLNLVTPSAGTGPFKTKRVMEKLEEGSAGNILSVMGSVERIVITSYSIHYTKLYEYKDWSIVAISFECGFNSKAAFNNFFKKYTEMTPSEYKKSFFVS